MPDASDIAVEQLSTEDAFELVAHETRLAIFEVLTAAARPLAFGELRERVGVEASEVGLKECGSERE